MGNVFSNCVSHANIENDYFQKSNIFQEFGMMEMHFSEVINSDSAAESEYNEKGTSGNVVPMELL